MCQKNVVHPMFSDHFVGPSKPTHDYSKALDVRQFYKAVFFRQMCVLKTFSYLRACRMFRFLIMKNGKGICNNASKML